MKTNIFTLSMIALLLTAGSIFAQTPQGINYQAVVRNGSGAISANAAVTFRFTFHEGSAAGTNRYTETFNATTDAYGMANVVLGTGANVSGAFSAVDWTKTNYLQTEVNLTGNFVNLGTSKFQSVPYALNAGSSSWTAAGANIYNSNSGNVGIGTNSPDQKLHVKTSSGYFHFQSLGTESTFQMQNNGSTGYISLGGWNMGATKLGFGPNSSPKMVVDFANGGVGIGTASPGYNLVVYGNGGVAQTQVGADADHFIHQYSGSTGDNDAAIVVDNGQALRFGTWADAGSTGWQENMRIASNGRVGIGTATPVTQLHVLHQTGGGTEGLEIERYGNSNWSFYVGDAGVGNELRLYAAGTLKGAFNATTGAYTALSDARLKTAVIDLEPVLEKVKALDVKRYAFISDPNQETHIGMIAQEVEKQFPEFVTHSLGDGADQYRMDYSGFGVLAIKAIQEQQAQIDALKAEIAAMKK